MNAMNVLTLIEKATKSVSRNYGDVKISEFGCGCTIINIVDDPQHIVFKDICVSHRKECEKKIRKECNRKNNTQR